MLHYLNKEEKNRSRELWEQAFPEDSDCFRDYYYTEKTRDNRLLVLEEGGQILSMLHRNPYLLQMGEKTAVCDYIVGVATDKNSRRKGYMRQLMEKALKDMREEGMPFCFLMPAFEALYLPFDFTYIYKKQSRELQQEKFSNLQLRRAENRDLQAAAAYMEAWLSKRYEVYAKRDFSYIERLKREIESENGCLELLFEKDTLAGMKAYWGMDKPEERLLFCEENYSRLQGEATPAIMGRIVNLPEFLSCIRLRETAEKEEYTVILEVEDRILPENAGLWKWTLNRSSSGAKRICPKAEEKSESKEKADISLEISEITAWLFGYSVPDSLGVWRERIRPFCGVFLDEIV